MDRVFLAVLGAIMLFGFASAQCDDGDITELQRLVPRVETCIAGVCRIAQNESACACCSRIQADPNRTPAEVSCCDQYTTTNSLYKQCKDRLTGLTGKAVDPNIVLEIINGAIQLGLEICKLINRFSNNAGPGLQGFPILGLLVIGIGCLGAILL